MCALIKSEEDLKLKNEIWTDTYGCSYKKMCIFKVWCSYKYFKYSSYNENLENKNIS